MSLKIEPLQKVNTDPIHTFKEMAKALDLTRVYPHGA